MLESPVLDSLQPSPGLVSVKVGSNEFVKHLVAFNSLPSPPVLPTGQPNTWLLEYTVEKYKRDIDTVDIRLSDGTVECLAHMDMWLWNAEKNTAAVRLPAHCKSFTGSLGLCTTATDQSPRNLDEMTSKLKLKDVKDAKSQALIELCICITHLLVVPFVPEEMFPEQFQRNKAKNPDRSRFHLGVTPHTILVFDKTLAEAMNRTLVAWPLDNLPHFVAIPFRRGRIPNSVVKGDTCEKHGVEVPIPVICAHCKVVGVTNRSPLGDAFKVLNRCAACSTTWYCSKECQRENWLNGHKTSCVKVDSKLTKVPTVCGCGKPM